MRKMEKALVVMTLLVAVLMTGATLATMQDNRNQNGNGNMNSNRGSRNRNSNRMNSNSGDNMNMGGGNMNSNMAVLKQMSAADSDFASMAAQGGIAEVQMAQLAQTKATSKEVQKYAKQMIKDHTKNNNSLMKIAAKKQITLPTTPNADQMQMMSQLQSASGADFDRMYMQMAGVQAHQMMQTLLQNYTSSGTDAELKSFASKTLPVVQKHLRMAQDMSTGGMSGGNSNMSGGMNSNMNMNMNGNMNMNMNSNSNRRNRNSNSNRGGNSNSSMNSNNSNR